MKLINKHFTLPFEPHDYQVEAMNDIVTRDCSLLQFKVGLGKTAGSLMAALKFSLEDGIEQILILCPPILLDQWYEFLLTVEGIPDVMVYRGTPKVREEMKLDASIILVSYNIFRGKKDWPRFVKLGKKSKLCVIADELSLKSLKSRTYRKVKELVYRKLRVKSNDRAHHKLIALNATPVSDLSQVYNWCAMFVPGVYGSKRIFETVHVEKIDHWGTVTEWKNEDLMKDNMGIFSVDTDEEVELPPLVETVVPYHLTPAHMKLYKEVEAAELDNLPEDKIELAINSMFSTLQRLILAPSEFGLNIKPPVMDFVEGYLDQAGDDGVLIYTRHIIVSKYVLDNLPGCEAIYGGVTKNKREDIFRRVKSGELKRLAGNMDSLGQGLNLFDLNHILYLELPFRDDKLTQTLGRVHRQGQTETCFACYPLAKDTLQYQIYYNLLQNGEDLGKVLKTRESVKQFLS